MVRRAPLLVLLLTLAGCRSGQTFENPFQTRVPPPGTAVPGTVPASAGAYDPNANIAPPFTPNTSAVTTEPPAALQPSTSVPAATPAGVAPQYAPPGGFDFRQTQATPVTLPPGTVTQPSATIYRPTATSNSPSQSRWGNGSAATSSGTYDRGVQPGAGGVAQASANSPGGSGAVHALGTSPASSASVGASSGREPPIRVVGPPTHRDEREGDTASSSTISSSSTSRDPREPRRLPQESEPVDIMELPPTGSRSANASTRPVVERTSFRSPSATREGAAPRGTSARRTSEQAAEANPNQAEARPAATNRASYGHDPGYAWMKGKLEYSRIDRRWKLRYIPIDGETDEHGGSVLLPDSPLLDGFEPGDFIAVQGALAGEASAGYAPPYELSRVKRLD